MAELVKIRKLEKLGAFRLRLWFNDGGAGEWDFSELSREAGPMVEPFKDSAYFGKVFLESGAPTWPNGFDWSPEALHADMLAAKALRFEGALA